MNPTVAGADGVVVLTQTIPPNGQHVIQLGPNILPNTQYQVSEALRNFFKGEPKALGVTQILIGLLQIILTIIITFPAIPVFIVIPVISTSVTVGVFFIISGSLSVAAKNHANMCLVQGSLAMNIFSAIGAFIGIVHLSIGLSFNYYSLTNAVWTAILGIQGVLLVLLILEFCISISTSAFGCKAVCCSSNSNMQSHVILQNYPQPETNFNPVASPMCNVNDHYRPEASFPSVPAPALTENSQYRPEPNLSAMATPLYNNNNIDLYRPHVKPPSPTPPTDNNNNE